MEKRFFRYDAELILESGETLSGIEICYHISKEYGKEAQPKKVVWITHALTANSNPCEWWDTMVGEGKYLDPRKFTIVCANILGSCYGSTNPLSINPKTGKPYMLGFPKTTVRDIAACHELLRKELGIEEIELLVGGSVGGFQALEWSIMSSSRIKNMILLACGARVTPWLGAFNETMRMALHADPTFEAQEYDLADGKAVAKGGKRGLAAARALALISYRSYTGYLTTQPETDEDTMWCTRVGSCLFLQLYGIYYRQSQCRTQTRRSGGCTETGKGKLHLRWNRQRRTLPLLRTAIYGRAYSWSPVQGDHLPIRPRRISAGMETDYRHF